MPLCDAARHVVGIIPLLVEEVRDAERERLPWAQKTTMGRSCGSPPLLIRHTVHRDVPCIRDMHLVPFVLLAYVEQ